MVKQPYNHPAMKTTAQLIARYGNPNTNPSAFEAKWMQVFVLPDNIHNSIPVLPSHLYMNKDIIGKFEDTMNKLITQGLHREIKTYDGCFNIRNQIGSKTISRHSFGIAIDLNAAWNPLNGGCSWSNEFLNVWRGLEWICGADFHSRSDAMHFEATAYNAF